MYPPDVCKPMREWIGWTAYAGFIALGAFGAGLAVAWLQALLDRAPSAASAQVKAGQRRQLRRYSACWGALVCAWGTAIAVLSLF
mgnify:CR=1 FL=1